MPAEPLCDKPPPCAELPALALPAVALPDAPGAPACPFSASTALVLQPSKLTAPRAPHSESGRMMPSSVAGSSNRLKLQGSARGLSAEQRRTGRLIRPSVLYVGPELPTASS
jgi:hypothetical protein